MPEIRKLIFILGDQLNLDADIFDIFEPKLDRIMMAEVQEESTHVPSHKVRTAYFLSSMRHFAKELEKKKYPLKYFKLDDADNPGSLGQCLKIAIEEFDPEEILITLPGDYRVLESIQIQAKKSKVGLKFIDDNHFLSSPEDFAEYAKGRKQIRMEFFYREMRKRYEILMDGDQPLSGKWNYDSENRKTFGKAGPYKVPEAISFKPDKITKEVFEIVEKQFSNHIGKLAHFDWPVTRKEALLALDDFIENRLESYGDYQDAMWTGEPFLYHSRISAALNVKLLNPLEVIQKVEQAYHDGKAGLAAVEGFIRQVLGWREYVRGIYWSQMPKYLEQNALNAKQDLPEFYWSGETKMVCLSQAIGQTIDYGYAHHIQRLMVTGLFALLYGVEPKQMHQWYLSVYIDAVEWVELPNTLGMSQYGDNGLMASKPYVASGKYIQRMSNYCELCPYDPAQATGEKACPFTTLYWDFLQRHRDLLKKNQRMQMQLRNLERKSVDQMKEIRKQAVELKKKL